MKKYLLKTSLLFSICIYLIEPSTAQSLQWVKSGGTATQETSFAVGVDNAGSTYILGSFTDSLVFGSSVLNASTNGSSPDCYLAKFDASGNALWGFYIPAYCQYLAVDGTGNCYIGSSYYSAFTFNGTNLTLSSQGEFFIAKIDSSGTFLWVNQSTTDVNSSSVLGGIAIDNNTYNVVVGASSAVSSTWGTNTLTGPTGSGFIFLMKINPTGNYVSSNKSQATGFPSVFAVAADANGNSYLAGRIGDSIIIGSTLIIQTVSNSSEFYFARFNAANNPVYAKKAGSLSLALVNNINPQSNGDVYICGRFEGSMTLGTTILPSTGGDDAFIAKYNTGGALQWAAKGGGIGFDLASSSVVLGNGDVLLYGTFSGLAAFGSWNIGSLGGSNFFFTTYDLGGTVISAVPDGGNSLLQTSGMVRHGNDLFITGQYSGTAQFASDSVISNGDTDYFLAKYSNTAGINNLHGYEDAIRVFPNPVASAFFINVSTDMVSSHPTVTLYDIFGRKIVQREITRIQTEINAYGISSGIYFYQIENSEGVIAAGKIVKK